LNKPSEAGKNRREGKKESEPKVLTNTKKTKIKDSENSSARSASEKVADLDEAIDLSRTYHHLQQVPESKEGKSAMLTDVETEYATIGNRLCVN
jgi:hypothetical protein